MGAFVRRYRAPATAWAVIGAVLLVVQRLGNDAKDGAMAWTWSGGRGFFGGWVQFDGWEYLHIATDGYWYRPDARAPVVFFPLYPLLVRGLRPLVDDPVLAGVAVSAAAGLAATLLFWRWMTDQGMAGAARATGLAVLLLYPYGWYLYGAVYSDALFLSLVLGAFVLASQRRYWLMALVGAMATAARPTGLALVPGLLMLVLTDAGALRVPDDARGWVARFRLPTHWDRAKFRPVLLTPLLALGGIAAYSVYLWVRFGSPFLYATDQSQYQGSGLKTLFKAGLVANLIHWDDPVYTLSAAAQAVLVVAMFFSVPALARRFGWGYGAFVLTLVTILTLVSRDYLGAGRYLIAAFPMAALVGEWLATRPRVRAAWLVTCAGLLVLLVVGFSQSRMLT